LIDWSFLGPRSAAPSFPPLELPDDAVLVPPPDDVVVDELELPPHAAITSAVDTHAATMVNVSPLREPAPLDLFFIFSPPLTN
jgi:hypothetical protein